MQKSSKSLVKSIIFISIFLLASKNIYSNDVSDSKINFLQKRMTEIFPTIKYDKIKKTPIENIYEIHYGGEIVYITEDGRYIFESGNLQKIEKEGKGYVFTNLTEGSATQGRKNLLDKIPDSKLFVYGDSKKNYINVVTDIDCPYCRKFHKDIPVYIENNIKVRYLVFAIKTSAKKKVVSAWCSPDRNRAFSLLKSEEKIKSINCENPINDHQEIISSIGVGSTPSIFLPDGSLILGYMSPEEIIKKINN